MKIFTEMTADKTRVCKCCGRELPIEAYPTNPRYRGMKGLTCNECVSGKKTATAERKAHIADERAQMRAQYEIARAQFLSDLRERLEAPQQGVGIESFSTKDLLDELRRRNMLNETAVRNYYDIYR